MLKTIKNFTLFSFVALVFFATSCLNSIDPVDRTEQDELEELNNTLVDLESQGFDIDTTELGVYYLVHKEGEGPHPQPGDTVHLEYTGYLLDGTLFDASANHYEDSIWVFKYKEIPVIPGFDDGIALLTKGAEIDMIVPSRLGYGEYGSGIIPPYTTLLFAIKLHDLNPE